MECCYISVSVSASVSKYVDNDPLLAYGQRERTHVNLSRERQALMASTEVTLELSCPVGSNRVLSLQKMNFYKC
jgi:archaellin